MRPTNEIRFDVVVHVVVVVLMKVKMGEFHDNFGEEDAMEVRYEVYVDLGFSSDRLYMRRGASLN